MRLALEADITALKVDGGRLSVAEDEIPAPVPKKNKTAEGP